MKVFVIGHTGHGKSTLVRAIEQLSKQNIECVVVNTQNLINISKEQRENEKTINDVIEQFKEVESFKENYIKNYKKRNKKGKQVKNWQKKNFWE